MHIFAYVNPYYKKDFFGFFSLLFQRLCDFAFGALEGEALFVDELQLLVLSGIAASSAIVGSFLVLRGMTMLANSLSHTILLGIVTVFLLTKLMLNSHGEHELNISAMLFASVLTGLLTTFLTEMLVQMVKLQEDASMGLVFSSLFAIGILLISMFGRSAHIGVEVVMGNVDALHIDDLNLVGMVLVLNILVFTLFFKEFKITSFDPQLSRALGISTVFFNYLLMIQVSATAIGAFRSVGVLMVLAFIVGPPISARMLTDRLGFMIFLSVLLGVLASVIGVALSRHLLSIYYMPLSTSGIVVCVIGGFYGLVLLCAPKKGMFVQLYHRLQLKRLMRLRQD